MITCGPTSISGSQLKACRKAACLITCYPLAKAEVELTIRIYLYIVNSALPANLVMVH